ncbi:MAG: hypothetical protein ACM3ME_07905 [Chloroflexota bacterium]|nr:hypothetical protein [Lentimicrobium sp.]
MNYSIEGDSLFLAASLNPTTPRLRFGAVIGSFAAITTPAPLGDRRMGHVLWNCGSRKT